MNEDWECETEKYMFSWHEGTLTCKDKLGHHLYSANSVNSWADYKEFVERRELPSLIPIEIIKLDEFIGTDTSSKEIDNLVKKIEDIRFELRNYRSSLMQSISSFEVICLKFMIENKMPIKEIAYFNSDSFEIVTLKKLSLDQLKMIEEFSNYSFEKSDNHWKGDTWLYEFTR